MKKIIVSSLVISVMFTASVLSADNTGCGLGTMLMKGKKGKVWEILAVTTNGTSASQTFAITTGTSEYQDGAEIASKNVDSFVAENMDYLAIDIARGQGKYLDTLAAMMKVKDKAAFAEKLKRNFKQIYTSDAITSKEVVTNINTVYNS